MKVSPRVPRTEQPRTLIELATNVRTARQVVHAQRVVPKTQVGLVTALHSLLQAEEAYASALTDRRLPIPHRLRDGLRLRREIARQPARTSRP